MRTLNTTLALGLATLLGSVQASDLHPQEPLAGGLVEQWADRFNRGDARALAGLYADDAVLMPPSDETVVSRAAIEEYWANTLTGLGDYNVEFVQTRAQGDVLYTAGIWSAARVGADGEREVVGGNVVRVLERQDDGSWKLRVETWN